MQCDQSAVVMTEESIADCLCVTGLLRQLRLADTSQEVCVRQLSISGPLWLQLERTLSAVLSGGEKGCVDVDRLPRFACLGGTLTSIRNTDATTAGLGPVASSGTAVSVGRPFNSDPYSHLP